MQDQPNPGVPFNLGEAIPKEHIQLVLNSIINERLLGFTRELVNSDWQWTGTGKDGTTTHELHDFVGNDFVAIDMVTRFCAAQEPPMAWQLNYIPHLPGVNERAIHQFYLLRPDMNAQPQTLQSVYANKIGLAISLAVIGLLEADVKSVHQTLFPGHYLVTH